MNQTILIIGGGIGGLQAAVSLAESGYAVELIDALPQLGGRLRGADAGVGVACMAGMLHAAAHVLEPLLAAVAAQPAITVRCQTELQELTGEAGRFQVRLKQNGAAVLLPLVSAVVWAPGFAVYEPPARNEYGYGHWSQVVTQLEWERRLAEARAAGSLATAGGEPPQRIAFVQCVGSRDAQVGAPYCSGLCCMVAAKQAALVQELVPTAAIAVFYLDKRACGKGAERLYQRIEANGVEFHPSLVAAVHPGSQAGMVRLLYSEQGNPAAWEADVVVLAGGVRPAADVTATAACLGVALDAYGFIQAADGMAAATSRPGIWQIGEPALAADIPDTLAMAEQACGAIRRQLGLFWPRYPAAAAKVVAVIGGGAAGLTASRALTSRGIAVCLIERRRELGGYFAEAAGAAIEQAEQAQVLQLAEAVSHDPGVRLLTAAQVTAVERQTDGWLLRVRRDDGRSQSVTAAAVILATGSQTLTPEAAFAYGQHPGILTLEEAQAAWQKAAWPAEPGAVYVFWQCVGSRSSERPYCSRDCCERSLRLALAIKAAQPDSRIYLLYRDIQTPGYGELLYQAARSAGIRFLRLTPATAASVVVKEGAITLCWRDSQHQLALDLQPARLILAAGQIPAATEESWGEWLGLTAGSDGFWRETHAGQRGLTFPNEAVWVIGNAHAPQPLRQAMRQAERAAARLCYWLAGKEQNRQPYAAVAAEQCAACLTCVRLCPYQAPRWQAGPGMGQAAIAAERCRGCGSCLAACPNRAIHWEEGGAAAPATKEGAGWQPIRYKG